MRATSRIIIAVLATLLPTAAITAEISSAVQKFVTVDSPVVALLHVRVIDGTGVAAREDQTVILRKGRITDLGPSATVAVPEDAARLDLSGKSLIPGLVGMHDHMFYPLSAPGSFREPGSPPLYGEMAYSFPRLYLAAGVTSLRTTGSVEPYTDLELKRSIDSGAQPGPHLHLTGPYLEGTGSYTPNLHQLTGVEDARRTVRYWAEEGMTSFKAYTHISHAELAAVIEEAHARGLKVTGHLCSIGFREAAELGIDNLEHGLLVDTEFTPGKTEDVCPSPKDARQAISQLDIEGPEVQGLIRDLVDHGVAVTSTLPIFETLVAGRPPLDRRVMSALAPSAQTNYLLGRALVTAPERSDFGPLLAKEMEFERAFVRAGGLLLSGNDPTGYGGVLAGFGDQREVELLVEAGFTPLQAIQIATENGARFLGSLDEIGTIAVGKRADLVVVDGMPDQDIKALEQVVTVFKDGVGYDSARLIESVQGTAGRM